MSPLAAFFKRFAVKFIEVVGAGIATAVSGYLLAHFSGYWSPRAGAPPMVQVSPNVSVVPKGERRQQQDATAVTSDQPGSSRQSARPPAKSNLTTASHTPAGNDIGHDDGKVRDAETIEAQVRAALANVDAGRSAPSNTTTQNPDRPPAGAAAVALPATVPLQKPADASAGENSVAAAPPAADVAPQPQPQAPSEPIPLTPVEIKSLPVAAVEPASTPPSEPSSVRKESQASPQADGSAGPQDDRSLFGAIKKIPEFFRAAIPASDADAPRPPRAVGE